MYIEYVVTIRKNENRIPSRSGYRADSGKDDGSTAAAITREITRESLPISSEQLTNAVVNRSESQGINASQSMYRRGEEGALPLPHTIGPPPNSSTPIYELAKALEGTSSNFHTYAQSEIDSSDFSDSGIQTRSDAKKKKPSLQRYAFLHYTVISGYQSRVCTYVQIVGGAETDNYRGTSSRGFAIVDQSPDL